MNDGEQSRENYEDLEPTIDKAEQITGGDTAPMVSNVLKTSEDTKNTIIGNIRA